VGEEDVLDRDLLGVGETATDRTRIYQGPVIDEEGRGALPGTLAAEGPKHPDVHSRAILA